MSMMDAPVATTLTEGSTLACREYRVKQATMGDDPAARPVTQGASS